MAGVCRFVLLNATARKLLSENGNALAAALVQKAFGWINAQGPGGVMQAVRGRSGRCWPLWALIILILLWTIAAAGDEKVNDILLGAAPQSLALNPITNIIYVTVNNPIGTNPGSVYVVDAVQQTVVTVVPVGRATSAPSMISLSSSARAMALRPPRCLLSTSMARCSSTRRIRSTSSSMILDVSSE